MGAINTIHAVFAKVSRITAMLRRQPDFVCGDCERWARCGLVSSDGCVAKAAQIARPDWELRRRTRALSRAMGGSATLIKLKTRSWK